MECSLSNLIAAVENGFFTETTNARLNELESRKAELKEIVARERLKEVKPITKEQVTDYLSYALTQPSQTMIDLLVRKALIKDDTIDVYLKYSTDAPPKDKATKDGRSPKNMNPERNLSERGSLFMSYDYRYEARPTGRKPLGIDDREGIPKNIVVCVFI